MLPKITYCLSFSKPYTHYCEVEINITGISKDKITFSMPVWTPGSYMVREFSKNVEGVTAEGERGERLDVMKVSKNSWEVITGGHDQVVFKYKVYCNEMSVRTSEINSDHAFISGSGVFMYARGFEHLPCDLKINRPPEWKTISTALYETAKDEFYARNYDSLIDSPIEIGNQEIIDFDVGDIPHSICMSGIGNYDAETIRSDFKKIAEEEIKLFGDIPYKHYTFIIHLVEKGGGGLEHLDSFVAQVNRWNFTDEKLYKKFLGLVSHEFFHVWNVKRIRPVELGPFDYDKENYTESLWVSEGWTSYYDNLILRRCGLLDNKEYFQFVDVEVNDIMRFAGRFNQSLAEASFDAWIKYYRRNENSNNSQVSYYTKGALVAMMLNIEIIKSTNAEKSLDDALRQLYSDYRSDNSKGFTPERVREICEKISASDLTGFWEKYVYGTDELPLAEYLNLCGLEIKNVNSELRVALDVESSYENGRFIVKKVFAGGTAYESGVNSGDEIISIGDMRVNRDNVKALLDRYSTGDVVNTLISRNGIIKNLELKILEPLPKFEIIEMESKSKQQEMFLSKWLNG